MPLNHPTDSSYVLDDGLTQFAPTGPGVTAGIFDPSTKSASITLSESNRTASLASGGAYHMARGDTQIVGEAYFEFTLLGVPSTTSGKIGVGLINETLTNYEVAMTTTDSAGFFAPNNAGGGGGYAHATGYGINGGGYTSVLSGQEWTIGLVIGMAVSMSARTVKITLDGTTWSPAMDITALGTTIYPGVGLYSSGDSIRMNAGNQPFVYTVPSGYAGMDIATTTYYGFGKVAGVTKVYDVGVETTPSGWLAQFEFSQIDKTAGENNTYYFVIAGSNDPTMATYEEVSNRWQASVVGTKPIVAFSTLSRASNTLLRYFAVLKILSGSSPSVTAYCFMEPLGDLSLYTTNEAIQILCFMADNDVTAFAQFRAWMTGPAWGGVNNDGVYPVSDGYGNISYLKSPAQLQAEGALNSPQYYGAIGDGTSHPASDFYDTLADLQVKYDFATSLYQEMDWLGTQAALYHGGGIESVTSNFVMCNSHAESQTPLIAISGTFDLQAHGSIWSYPGMIKQSDSTEFVTNPNFATSSNWTNASIYDPSDILMTTFGSGAATMTDTGSGDATQLTFYQWGQQVTLSAGRYTVTCVVTAELGDSYALGNVQPPYAGIGFSSDSPGEGSNPTGREAFTSLNVFLPDPDVQTLTFDFQIDTSMTAWLTFTGGGYWSGTVTSFSIKKWFPNCAVLATRDGSPEHYPIPRGFDGVEFVGPGYDVDVAGIKYKSFSNIDGNLIRFSNSVVQQFGQAFRFGDGAYLPEFNNVHIYSNGTALYTEVGTTNAGENLRFYGGGIYNNEVGIDGRGGMEITLYGTAFDYCTQMIINGKGRYELHAVHLETHMPTDAAKPTFHLTTGHIAMHGGMILGVGSPLTAACAPIKTDYSSALFECYGTELYNVSSDPAGDGAGAMISGPGQFVTHGWRNSGNPNIGPSVVSYAAVMDLLAGAGNFPEPDATTEDPTGISIEGGNYPDALPRISVTASISGSTMTVTAITAPDQIYEGMTVQGPGVKGEPLISFIPTTGGTGGTGTYRLSIPQTLASATLSLGFDGQVNRWNSVNGTLEWTDEYTIDGSNCLKFTKINDGLNAGLRLLFRTTPRCSILGGMKFLFPIDYSPTYPDDTAPVYYRLFWVRVIGYDKWGRPIISGAHFAGETDLYMPLAGSPTPVARSFNTTYATPDPDPTNNTSNHSPEWATHLGIFIDTQPLVAGQSFYFGKMIATALR